MRRRRKKGKELEEEVEKERMVGGGGGRGTRGGRLQGITKITKKFPALSDQLVLTRLCVGFILTDLHSTVYIVMVE